MNAAEIEAPAFQLPPQDPRLAEWLKDYPSEVFDDRLHQSIELMERYSIELALDLLRELGVLDQINDWKSSVELCRTLTFQPGFASALAWLLERLVETDFLEARHEGVLRSYRLTKAVLRSDLP